MEFDLTEEQRLIQETVRSFVDERVLPNAIENDIEHRLDMGVIEGMAELDHPLDHRHVQPVGDVVLDRVR